MASCPDPASSLSPSSSFSYSLLYPQLAVMASEKKLSLPSIRHHSRRSRDWTNSNGFYERGDIIGGRN
jgi:hypothetical protein